MTFISYASAMEQRQMTQSRSGADWRLVDELYSHCMADRQGTEGKYISISLGERASCCEMLALDWLMLALGWTICSGLLRMRRITKKAAIINASSNSPPSTASTIIRILVVVFTSSV